MKTKHTQGPWAYGESVDSMWYVEAEGRIIAEVMPGNPGEAEENAQLMAAAPLMLEALLMAFDRDLTYLSDHAEIPRQDVVRARLAIHAALGLQANLSRHCRCNGQTVGRDGMKPDLYIKKVSPKGRVTYQPLTMEILDGQEERHLTDAEAMSAALTLATIATTNALKLLPPKKAVVTRIDRTLTGCLKAFQEYNVRIDEELMHHLTWCWNMTMILASMVEVEEGKNES